MVPSGSAGLCFQDGRVTISCHFQACQSKAQKDGKFSCFRSKTSVTGGQARIRAAELTAASCWRLPSCSTSREDSGWRRTETYHRNNICSSSYLIKELSSYPPPPTPTPSCCWVVFYISFFLILIRCRFQRMTFPPATWFHLSSRRVSAAGPLQRIFLVLILTAANTCWKLRVLPERPIYGV